jgi:hypothetical protein
LACGLLIKCADISNVVSCSFGGTCNHLLTVARRASSKSRHSGRIS